MTIRPLQPASTATPESALPSGTPSLSSDVLSVGSLFEAVLGQSSAASLDANAAPDPTAPMPVAGIPSSALVPQTVAISVSSPPDVNIDGAPALPSGGGASASGNATSDETSAKSKKRRGDLVDELGVALTVPAAPLISMIPPNPKPKGVGLKANAAISQIGAVPAGNLMTPTPQTAPGNASSGPVITGVFLNSARSKVVGQKISATPDGGPSFGSSTSIPSTMVAVAQSEVSSGSSELPGAITIDGTNATEPGQMNAAGDRTSQAVPNTSNQLDSPRSKINAAQSAQTLESSVQNSADAAILSTFAPPPTTLRNTPRRTAGGQVPVGKPAKSIMVNANSVQAGTKAIEVSGEIADVEGQISAETANRSRVLENLALGKASANGRIAPREPGVPTGLLKVDSKPPTNLVAPRNETPANEPLLRVANPMENVQHAESGEAHAKVPATDSPNPAGVKVSDKSAASQTNIVASRRVADRISDARGGLANEPVPDGEFAVHSGGDAVVALVPVNELAPAVELAAAPAVSDADSTIDGTIIPRVEAVKPALTPIQVQTGDRAVSREEKAIQPASVEPKPTEPTGGAQLPDATESIQNSGSGLAPQAGPKRDLATRETTSPRSRIEASSRRQLPVNAVFNPSNRTEQAELPSPELDTPVAQVVPDVIENSETGNAAIGGLPKVASRPAVDDAGALTAPQDANNDNPGNTPEQPHPGREVGGASEAKGTGNDSAQREDQDGAPKAALDKGAARSAKGNDVSSIAERHKPEFSRFANRSAERVALPRLADVAGRTVASGGQNSDGILDAKQATAMARSAQNEFSDSRPGKNLPAAGRIDSLETRIGPNEREARVRVSEIERLPTRVLASPVASDDGIKTFEHKTLAAAEAGFVRSGRLTHEIWSSVESFRATGLKDWEVRIRPDPETQLNLKLTLQDNQLHIQAKVENGNWENLAPRWNELQAFFADRGVHLRALEFNTPQNWNGNQFGQSGSSQNEQRAPQFEFAQKDEFPQSGMEPTNEPAKPRNSSGRAGVKSGAAWETWA